MVREENKKHRPDLQEYNHGVLASLPNCISLTLTERIQLLDLSGLQPDNLSVTFSFTWGLDGSGDHSDYAQLSKFFENTGVYSNCNEELKTICQNQIIQQSRS